MIENCVSIKRKKKHFSIEHEKIKNDTLYIRAYVFTFKRMGSYSFIDYIISSSSFSFHRNFHPFYYLLLSWILMDTCTFRSNIFQNLAFIQKLDPWPTGTWKKASIGQLPLILPFIVHVMCFHLEFGIHKMTFSYLNPKPLCCIQVSRRMHQIGS